MYWTLELASKLEDAPWPATKDELIDYAMRSGSPLEVIENLQEMEDEGEIYADTTSPTVKIETVEDENTIQQSETFDVKLTFSEKVEGLAKERITVNNGEIASIKTEDNKTYIVTVKNNIPDGTTG